MRARPSPVAACFVLAAVALAGARAGAAPPAANTAEFFEAKIRPVLVAHCVKCHSADADKAKKLRGGLYVDTRDGLLTGGDSGPAVVAGKPGESPLVQSLRYAGDVKMPPAGKLPDAFIADFEAWVAAGAHDPRTTPGGSVGVKKQIGMTVEAGREFWAFKPVTDPTPPNVKNAAWPVNDIDRFVLAKLEANGLTPAADADPLTLLRRVTFDLTGLPPTPAEIDAFLKDSALRTPHSAFLTVVDRLLASPAYGERWGRHWLDVARYAESVTLRGMIFREAWRYRDYAIDSFNRDRPFDRFLREQVAGDLLPAATPDDRRRQLVATTYLMMGNNNLEEQDKKQLRMDVVDEQIDVITRGILGVTVSCARCHDHKFDPVPTADYYALAGILRNSRTLVTANVSNWTEMPLPLDPAAEKEVAAREARISAVQAKIKALGKPAPGDKPAGILAVAAVPGVAVDDADAKRVGDWQHSVHSGQYVGAGYLHDKDAGKGDKTLTFAPKLPADGKYEVLLAYSPGDSRSAAAPVTVFGADGEVTVPVDMRKVPPIGGRFVSLGTFQFEKAGQSFVIVSNEGTKGHVTADCVTFIPAGGAAAPAPGAKPTGKAAELAALEAELKSLKAAAGRPKAMAPVEEKVIEDARVHVRGLVSTQGDVVPRGVLRVATRGPAPVMPKGQSGRKELADWLAAPDNPLTARVFTNRAWHWLFGAGLVRTVDNFGVAGEAPSHPELLDHLATRFVRNGWSVKQLVRLIVTSRTYRQASVSPAAAADPDNRLLGRANRRRLDAECVRDAALVAGGELAPFAGGPTVPATLSADYNHASPLLVRGVYLPALRNSVPDLHAAFDAADSSTVTGARNTSTVAPQALAMMNHPFVAARAAAAGKRLVALDLPDDAARTAHAYRLALGRDPTSGERGVTAKFVAGRGGDADAWAAVFHALFASADFRFLD